MGSVLLIVIGCFLGWCSISIIRNGYFVGRIISDPTRSKRYYRAGHPLEFWLLAVGGIVLAIVLISAAVFHLARA